MNDIKPGDLVVMRYDDHECAKEYHNHLFVVSDVSPRGITCNRCQTKLSKYGSGSAILGGHFHAVPLRWLEKIDPRIVPAETRETVAA